ncbi:hypothetical protein CYMTET_37385 [Cymbomonas tetramitiformis]|uniref:Uncharacterized protein n=1 Tax=Cymbomonas tetramitiformis TaxID=36881 RepID=A0AAE0F628_9CHLO|nr:hypothetical protein CYMTET_37385 [Cymbomonas tetramitiformis]
MANAPAGDDVTFGPIGVGDFVYSPRISNNTNNTHDERCKFYMITDSTKMIENLYVRNAIRDARVNLPPEKLGEFNREYSIVCYNGKTLIARSPPDRNRPVEFMAAKVFLEFHCTSDNKLIVEREEEALNGDGSIYWKKKIETKDSAAEWLQHSLAKRYYDVEFVPGDAGELATQSTFNLWRGWPVGLKPEGDCSLWKALLLDLCRGDHVVYKWTFDWFADIIQNPNRKPGSALVFCRDVGGRGGDALVEFLGMLVGQAHYFEVTGGHQLTSAYDRLMQSLLVVVDLAVWVRNKTAGDILKCMVTDEKSYMGNNTATYMRTVFFSNDSCVVPLDRKCPRYICLYTSGIYRDDFAFFELLREQMLGEQNGLGSLFHELSTANLSSWDAQSPPIPFG